jgi:hypothetical protein
MGSNGFYPAAGIEIKTLLPEKRCLHGCRSWYHRAVMRNTAAGEKVLTDNTAAWKTGPAMALGVNELSARVFKPGMVRISQGGTVISRNGAFRACNHFIRDYQHKMHSVAP